MAGKITAIKGVPLAEISRRGQAIVDALPAELRAAHDGEVVAVDVDSGAYALAPFHPRGSVAASAALRAKCGDPLLYVTRLGRSALYTFGAGNRRTPQ